ncbi:MAG TPA: methyl-accepting chemotaxis protein [Actinomycetota bacterium]|nr:methyl-accepting chemotaxis protein [Actinomycetota bacterium]
MRIQQKLLIAFGVPAVITLLVTVVISRALTNSVETEHQVVQTQEIIAAAHSLVGGAERVVANVRGFVITGRDGFLANYDQTVREVHRDADRLKAALSGDRAQTKRVEDLRDLFDSYIRDAATPMIAATKAGDDAEARRLVATTGGPIIDDLGSAANELIEAEEAALADRTERSRAASQFARAFVIAGLGSAIALIFAIGIAMARRLSNNAQAVTNAARALARGDIAARAEVRSRDEIGELATSFNDMADRLADAAEQERTVRTMLESAVADYSQFAARVAEGDLTVRVSASEDESLGRLSENLNSMVAALSQLSSQVRDGAHSMSAATSEILAAVSQHTASASEQSAAINETSTTVEEVRAAAEQTATKAREVAEHAQTSVQVSDDGTEAVADIVDAMNQIRDQVQAIARDILTLSEQSQQIAEITTTVNDLADQSNILALNASIEAAKAGEHGKGFSVVATEVRSLAEQSKRATEQVRTILRDVEKANVAAVLATEDGTKVVERGIELSARAGEVIESLTETIRRAAQAAQQIAASAQQQSVGMDQIAHAMKDVSEGTTQFVAGAQQSQQAAEDLNVLSRTLSSLAERYRL